MAKLKKLETWGSYKNSPELRIFVMKTPFGEMETSASFLWLFYGFQRKKADIYTDDWRLAR